MALTKVTNKSLSASGALVILFPVGVIITALLLFIFVIPQSYSQITTKLNSYKEQKANYENLQKKLAVLQSTSPAILDQTAQAVAVMPDKNPVLPFLSQMKNIAIEKNVTLTDIKTNAVSDIDNGGKKLELEVSLEGESFDSLISLYHDLATRAPLVTLDEVVISDLQATKASKAKISVYWAPLPTSLPGLTEPLPAFSPEELKALEKMNRYTLPDFSTLTPGVPAPRENPFN